MKLYTPKSGKKFICFSRNELLLLYKNAKQQELRNEMEKCGFSVADLRNDPSKMEELVDLVGGRGAQHRDEHEVFASLFIFPDFYTPNTEICFEVRDTFDANEDKIEVLTDLYKYRKLASDSDFLLKSADGFRNFQLKRYRGKLDVASLFKFIVKVLTHYGNALGDTNLLIQLQAPAWTNMSINFHELHELLKSQNYKFNSSILISYNHKSQRQIIITVHPTVGKTEIPFEFPSTKYKSF